MKYKVLAHFEDLKDDRHAYYPGDSYPRDGSKASEGRIKELSTSKNRLKKPLIAPFEDGKTCEDKGDQITLGNLGIQKLRNVARDLGIDTGGLDKKQLIAEIEYAQRGPQ